MFCLHGETKIHFVKIVLPLYHFFSVIYSLFSFRLNSDQQLYIMKDQLSTFYFRNVCCKYLIKWPMYALQYPYLNNGCRIEYYTIQYLPCLSSLTVYENEMQIFENSIAVDSLEKISSYDVVGSIQPLNNILMYLYGTYNSLILYYTFNRLKISSGVSIKLTILIPLLLKLLNTGYQPR